MVAWISTVRRAGAAFVLAAAGLLGACGGVGDAEAPPAASPPPPATAAARVDVSVIDAGAAPIAGVRVSVEGGPAGMATTTAADGTGRIELAATTSVLLRFSKDGFTDNWKQVEFGSGAGAAHVLTSLRPRDAGQALDASAGGRLAGRAGAVIDLPAGALVDAATGAAVGGAVDIAMTPIDVSGDELRSFPGEFVGIDAAGQRQSIASYGTTEFVLTQGGRRLQLAPGRTATIELPIFTPYHDPATPVVVGDVIPLWSLDETTGIWKQEGTGTVVASTDSPTGLALRATVGHFSWWNCDVAVETGRLDLDITLPDNYALDDSGIGDLEGRTVDAGDVRQMFVKLQTVFDQDPYRVEGRRHAQGVSHAGPRGLVLPSNRSVAITACALVRTSGMTMAGYACGTSTVSTATGATVKTTISIVPDERRNVPVISSQPQTQRVDAGTDVTFSVVAARAFGGNEALSYQWAKNSVPIPGATSASLVVPAVTSAEDLSRYAVTVIAPAGVTLSQTAWLVLNAPPPPPPPPAPPPPPPPNAGADRHVDAVAGNDVNPGTAALPYRTISKAFTAVASGGTIWLADGVWTAEVDPALSGHSPHYGLNCNTSNGALVAGTTLRAVNPGRATIRYQSVNAICVKDTQVRGIRLENGRTDFYSPTAISATAPGSSLLSGVSFEGGRVLVFNGARLTIEAAGLASYGNIGGWNGYALTVDGAGSEIVVNGGAFDRLSAVVPNFLTNCLASLMSSRGARLVLNQVALTAGAARSADADRTNGIAVCGGSVELNGSTLTGFVGGTTLSHGTALALYGGRATLTDSVITGNRYGVYVEAAALSLTGASSVERSELNGIYLVGNAALAMGPGSAVRENGEHGIASNGYGAEIFVDLSGAELSGNARSGMQMQFVKSCRVRNTRFSGNVQSGALIEAGTTCDLGTAASPGGNVFGNLGTHLVVSPSSSDPVFTLQAVGNTWTPNQQGADAQGRYVVPSGQTVYEVKGRATAGANYGLNWTNVTLRLAE